MRRIPPLSKLLPAAVLALAPSLGCVSGGDTVAASTAPTITAFSPTSGSAGDSVALTGTNFTGASAVKFNGTASGRFTVDSATQITAQVPAQATTGALSVTTASGTATSSSVFTVTLPAAPVVSGFSPSSGAAGGTVNVTGSGFASLSGATVAGAGCAYALHSATSLSLTVPAEAAGSGPLTVTGPGGTGCSAASFTVLPAVARMEPQRGPAGTPVVLTGTGFLPGGSAVAFSGVPAAGVSVAGPTQLTAAVPAGAGTGAVTLTVNAATVPAGTFTVGAASTTADLCIEGMYLVQSVQDRGGTVPLVASRDAWLRVFVRANQASVPPPAVQVTITNGTSPWTQTIAAPSGLASTPTLMDEGTWGTSWNLPVPGVQLQPGATILARVNPAGAVPEVDGTNNSFPVSGSPAALDVRTVPVFRTTLVAITQQGLTGNVSTGRTPESWADRLQRMYPMGGLDVQVRAVGALATTANLNSASMAVGDASGWSMALAELEAKRVVEASTRYYFGCVNVSYSGGTAGLGYVPSRGSSAYRSALGWDKTGGQDGYNYPEVFAHEVGHNFGRSHAPCGVADPDPDWPTDPAHAQAAIGVYGYDVANATLELPSAQDIMSYCDGYLWVSDYTYKGVLAFRAASPLGDAQASWGTVPGGARECLLVSGTVRNGEVELHPAFQVRTVPTATAGVSHELLLEDARGGLLQRAAFEPVPVADLPGGGELRHFVFALPVEAATLSALQRLRVRRGAEILAERRSSAPSAVREPVAMAMKPGLAHLSWDREAHRKVLVRDPRTGEVLAFLEGGSAMLETDARELEFTFSDGVRSERRMLKVLE